MSARVDLYSRLVVAHSQYVGGALRSYFSAYSDFTEFPGLRTVNPIVTPRNLRFDPVLGSSVTGAKVAQAQGEEFSFTLNYDPEFWYSGSFLHTLWAEPKESVFLFALSRLPFVLSELNDGWDGGGYLFTGVPFAQSMSVGTGEATGLSLSIQLTSLPEGPVDFRMT